MKTTLTVNTQCHNTVVGSRQQVDRHFNEFGVALWLRACGKKATLFYRDQLGKKRQRTFSKIRVVHAW